MDDIKRRMPTRLPNLAQLIEYNLYFNEQIELLRKKETVTDKDLFELRKHLKEKGIADLSQFWDGFLRDKITLNLRFRDLLLSCAPITPTVKNEATGEFHYVIEVYPETTADDVLHSFRQIMRREEYPEKPILQPTYNQKALDAVYNSIGNKQKISEVQKDLRAQGFDISLSTLYNYKKRMMQGTE